MSSVTIDAGVLAVPKISATSNDTYRYIETLLDWKKLLDEPWVAIYMSENASGALLEDGLYPIRDQLKQLFNANGIEEYDVNTVAQVVDTLLQKTPSFETFFRIREVLMEHVSTTPDILQLNSGSQLRSDLARCVVLIAILRDHCRSPVKDHSLILRDAPGRVIRVRAMVHDLEHDRDDIDALPTPPDYFSGDVLICDDFTGLINCLDESAIFMNSTDDIGMETSIRIALYKSRLGRGMEPEWDKIRPFRIGCGFLETAKCICQGQADSFPSKVLRSIVETLDKLNLSAVHALRTGSGGGNTQRVRSYDNAKAWRRVVDSEYRLHYWESQDGAIELASIGVHNNFTIPE